MTTKLKYYLFFLNKWIHRPYNPHHAWADVDRLLRSIANIYRYCNGKTVRSTKIQTLQKNVPEQYHDRIERVFTATKPFPKIQALLVR